MSGFEETGVTRVSLHLGGPDANLKRRRPALHVLRGWNVGALYLIDELKLPLVMGRDKNAGLCIDHDSVSRQHAVLDRDPLGSVFVRDNGSTNGIFVNGKKVPSWTLQPGDKFYLGEIIIRYDLLDEDDIGFTRDVRDKINASKRDALTNLLSKGYFLEEVPKILQYSHKKKRDFFIVAIDIDHFKMVNDTYGHQAGDVVLQAVSAMLQKGIRENDLAIRYGGEELIAILFDLADNTALQVANRLREEVAKKPIVAGGKEIPVTISLGVSRLLEGDTLETLFQRADAALYHSKKAGRNRLTAADEVRT